jgi:hypothetical protein
MAGIALHHGAVDNFPGSAEPANEGIRLDTLTAVIKDAGQGNA